MHENQQVWLTISFIVEFTARGMLTYVGAYCPGVVLDILNKSVPINTKGYSSNTVGFEEAKWSQVCLTLNSVPPLNTLPSQSGGLAQSILNNVSC